jgi:hypothetical protein
VPSACARRVDPREEGLEEGALAGRDLCQPAPEVELGAEEGVRASVRAHEDEAADELGVPKGQLLRDGASHREAGDVGARDLKHAQQRGGVVGHRARREAPLGQRRAPRTAVVEGGEEVAVREPVELWLPRFGGVAEARDEQDVGSVPSALGPDLGAVGVNRFAHLQPPRSHPESVAPRP